MALMVTGIFNVAQQAQQAVENLISSGFMADCIDLMAHNSLNENSGNDSATRTKSKQRVDTSKKGSGSDRFFCNPSDAVYQSASAAARALVVTVRTEIDELAKLAAGILDESGAVDIEKKAAEYGFGGAIVFN